MRTKFILISVLAVAFILRIWQIQLVPFGFTPDEASFGYDSYSILHTARDQWGHFLPLTLESFGDYKLPLYSYLALPSIAMFGLNVFSVRFPNAVLGTLAVLATYLMVRQFMRKNRSSEKSHAPIDIVAAVMLCISPWHIMMSRGAFEANLTTFLMPLGVYLLLLGLNNSLYVTLSALVFGLNLFSYHSARLVTPLLLTFLIFILRKELFTKDNLTKNLRKYIFPAMIFVIFLATAFYTLLLGGARRAQDISIFSGAVNEASDQRFAYLYQGIPQNLSRLFINKYTVISKKFFNNYFQYFSPRFLFIDGPAEATYGMIPGRGVLYWFELPFLIIFLYALIKEPGNSFYKFLVFWILVAPIPAALTMGTGYSANRAEIMLPALSIVSAVGFMQLNRLLKTKFNQKLLLIAYAGITATAFSSFFVNYYFVSPYSNSKAMLWGNLDAAYWLKNNSKKYTNIIISKGLSEPHIYIAFANDWDPGDYQQNSRNWEIYKQQNLKFLDQMEKYDLGKYRFAAIDYKKMQTLKDTLLVGKPDEFPQGAHFIAKFYAPNGEPAVVIADTANEIYADAGDQYQHAR